MKKVSTIAAFAALISSCGYNQQEQMLYDWVNQGTMETIKTEAKNIGFKIKEIKKVQEITAKDSLNLLLSTFEDDRKGMISDLENDLKTAEHLRETTLNNIEKLKNINSQEAKDYIVELQATLEKTERIINDDKKNIESYNNDCVGTPLEKTFKRIQEYKTLDNSKLCDIYKATHTIKNPLLNIEQTISHNYYTNREGNKIVKQD
jgi:lipoprotein